MGQNLAKWSHLIVKQLEIVVFILDNRETPLNLLPLQLPHLR